MQKPITIILDDTRRALLDIINSAGIPATLLLPVAADIYNGLSQASQQELAADRQAYEAAMEKEEGAKKHEDQDEPNG